MDNNHSDTPEVEELSEGQSFYFSCHPGVPCFTDCCRQLELELTPYDVLRLKKQVGLTGREFLEQHVEIIHNDESAFPRLLLRMSNDDEATCPFLSKEGCKVYEGRPGACRTYPLGRGAWRDKEGKFHAAYVLLREDHCLGFTDEYRQTVNHWLEHQELIPYNKANDHLMTLLYHPVIKAGYRPSAEQCKLYLETLFHLEEYRESVRENIGIDMSDKTLLDYGVNQLKMKFFSPSARGCRRKNNPGQE